MYEVFILVIYVLGKSDSSIAVESKYSSGSHIKDLNVNR